MMSRDPDVMISLHHDDADSPCKKQVYCAGSKCSPKMLGVLGIRYTIYIRLYSIFRVITAYILGM